MTQDGHKRSRQRGEAREAGETRRLILQAAQHLFAAHGYRAVTTRQIAEACGITQPALYKHFADKQEIYMSMLLGEVAQIKAALERIAQREVPLHEHLRLSALYLFNNSHHDVGMITHDMSNELMKEAQETLENAFVDSLVRPLASMFEDGIHKELLRRRAQGGVNPMMAALIFLHLIDLFAAQELPGLASEKRRSVTEKAELVVRLALHGVAGPSGQGTTYEGL